LLSNGTTYYESIPSTFDTTHTDANDSTILFDITHGPSNNSTELSAESITNDSTHYHIIHDTNPIEGTNCITDHFTNSNTHAHTNKST
jgi:hypothetical protein